MIVEDCFRDSSQFQLCLAVIHFSVVWWLHMARTCRSLSVPKGLTTRDLWPQYPPSHGAKSERVNEGKLQKTKTFWQDLKWLRLKSSKVWTGFILRKWGDKIMTHSTYQIFFELQIAWMKSNSSSLQCKQTTVATYCVSSHDIFHTPYLPSQLKKKITFSILFFPNNFLRSIGPRLGKESSS